jgi:hypothetical protein
MRSASPLSTGENRPSDDLNALLQAYFRAEMPDPWPPAPSVVPVVLRAEAEVGGGGLFRSRLALAASVALLIAGTMAVPNRVPRGETAPALLRLGPGEATHVKLAESLDQSKNQPAQPHNRATEELPPRK